MLGEHICIMFDNVIPGVSHLGVHENEQQNGTYDFN